MVVKSFEDHNQENSKKSLILTENYKNKKKILITSTLKLAELSEEVGEVVVALAALS